MKPEIILEEQWQYLLSFLPPAEELEASSRSWGAIVRRRSIDSPQQLLRLIMAYGLCGLSLRQTAAWAEAIDLASLSDVAVLKRFRASANWIGHLLGVKLAERAAPTPGVNGRLRLVDATTISSPGSAGTDWRLHLCFDLKRLAITEAQLSDASGAETFKRFGFSPGDIVIGDRGYAHRSALAALLGEQTDFIVRLPWATVPLEERSQGEPFDLLTALRSVEEAAAGDFPVQFRADRRKGSAVFPARLVAVRKSEAAASEARKKLLRKSSKRGKPTDPRSFEAATYVILLTSLDTEQLSAQHVLDLYRFRWQIELCFKRLKSLLHLDQLPAKDSELARTYLLSKLLAAVLLDDFTTDYLSFSPWGFRVR